MAQQLSAGTGSVIVGQSGESVTFAGTPTLGAAGGTLGFYGLATPIAQPSVTAIGTTTISQVATSGKWAFASSTAAIAFVARVRSIQDKLDALNLIVEA
jgi:hypothetical protein